MDKYYQKSRIIFVLQYVVLKESTSLYYLSAPDIYDEDAEEEDKQATISHKISLNKSYIATEIKDFNNTCDFVL